MIAVNDDIGDGRPVHLRSLDLTRYWTNPQVLFEHGRVWRGSVGLSDAIGFDDRGRMVADFTFLTGDPRVDLVRNQWDKGFLKAASIRAIPKQTSQAQSAYPSGLENKHELIEWSIVTIPGDEDAVRSGLTRDLENVLGFLRGENDDMDEAKIAEMITRAFEKLDQKGQGFDIQALARSLAESIETQVKGLLKERDDAAEVARKLADEKTAADKKTADDLKRSTDSAEDRADLLVLIRDLLPEGTVARGKTNKELLVLAAGEEVQDAAKRSEEYLLAKVEGIVERRADAGPTPLVPSKNPKPGNAPVLTGSGLSVADMIALRTFNQQNPN